MQPISGLRQRLLEVRSSDAPLASWRMLQLEILEAVKQLRRTAESHLALWALMGDAFWLESDRARLSTMIEDVLSEIEHQARRRP